MLSLRANLGRLCTPHLLSSLCSAGKIAISYLLNLIYTKENRQPSNQAGSHLPLPPGVCISPSWLSKASHPSGPPPLWTAPRSIAHLVAKGCSSSNPAPPSRQAHHRPSAHTPSQATDQRWPQRKPQRVQSRNCSNIPALPRAKSRTDCSNMLCRTFSLQIQSQVLLSGWNLPITFLLILAQNPHKRNHV